MALAAGLDAVGGSVVGCPPGVVGPAGIEVMALSGAPSLVAAAFAAAAALF
ncbi:MAG TPA: hypothetical protein VE221_03165 [Sphingomicrobium sp.]|nr:hypothetical protein [Sphingomicrobium sp.]